MNSEAKPDGTIKLLFLYDENKFSETVTRMTSALIDAIHIGVWAPGPGGYCVNILESNLSGTDFDSLAQRAAYTTYEGHFLDLAKIGLV